MANRRCIERSITESLQFLSMGKAAQALYMHLVMNADDDGVCEAGTILRVTRTRRTALEELIKNNYIAELEHDYNIVWLVNWQRFNRFDTRRSHASYYRETLLKHFPTLELADFQGFAGGFVMTNDKQSFDNDAPKRKENNIKENNIKESSSKDPPPQRPASLDEIRDYCQEYGINTDIERFFDFNEAHGWKIGDVNADWRDLLYLWIQHDKEKG